MVVGLADFHHIEFSVANASQSAYWFCCSFGFQRFARMENARQTSVAVQNNEAKFVFTSRKTFTEEERGRYILHGDTVTDVTFQVDNLDSVVQVLKSQNIDLIVPSISHFDHNGSVQMATLRSEETDVYHTLIELENYDGCFLPGYVSAENFSISSLLESIPLRRIDHVVQNYPEESIETTAAWYKKTLELKRFWSADDLVAKTEYTAITAWLLVNEDKKVQYTIAETVKGHPGRSQTQEFIDYNGGPGIQHIALLVDDIVATVITMKSRSVEFLTIPDSYYEILKERLSHSRLDFSGDVELLKRHKILMDFDDHGYLLQIFTKPVQDKPTLFFEIIQRRNFDRDDRPSLCRNCGDHDSLRLFCTYCSFDATSVLSQEKVIVICGRVYCKKGEICLKDKPEHVCAVHAPRFSYDPKCFCCFEGLKRQYGDSVFCDQNCSPFE